MILVFYQVLFCYKIIIFKTFEISWFEKHHFLNFASLFVLFVDLLPSLFMKIFCLLFSSEKVNSCSYGFFWLYFDVVYELLLHIRFLQLILLSFAYFVCFIPVVYFGRSWERCNEAWHYLNQLVVWMCNVFFNNSNICFCYLVDN